MYPELLHIQDSSCIFTLNNTWNKALVGLQNQNIWNNWFALYLTQLFICNGTSSWCWVHYAPEPQPRLQTQSCKYQAKGKKAQQLEAQSPWIANSRHSSLCWSHLDSDVYNSVFTVEVDHKASAAYHYLKLFSGSAQAWTKSWTNNPDITWSWTVHWWPTAYKTCQ